MNDIFAMFEESGLNAAMLNILSTLGPKSDTSPKGFFSLLNLIHDSVFFELSAFAQKIFSEDIIKILCGLLKDAQLAAIQEWPASYGGGSACAQLIAAQLLRIFNLPYSQPVSTDTSPNY